MSALAAIQSAPPLGGGLKRITRHKVKGSTIIYQGGMLGITTAGYLRPFATGDFFAGHALETVDNSAGADGALWCEHSSGDYLLQVPVFSSATVASIGQEVWTSTDNHADLTLTDPGTTLTTTDLVGYVHGIDTNGDVQVNFRTRKN